MKNNFCEDSCFDDAVQNFHEHTMNQSGLPEWLVNLTCPFCRSELPLRGIRSIALKLNSRNFGDIAVELYCYNCRCMDTVYLQGACNDLDAFVECLRGVTPEAGPITEEKMYSLQYHNIVTRMMAESDETSNIKESPNDHD